ncbi:uncharacterized protein EV420DRAFT_1265780 [Desarmillaria tabescens]|uniref:Nucleotidyltransferase n=1 Tax=Armillaria tabescens TaxID=1929756 RepID=A0AA39NAZ3_ARMTA|nr:uncharacterized protein EV420DRAFT_1265780 [Desarmillaria tabescens]KAK0462279.1 hypothetical protein EV420DRAFT_1265780 [Desarmillaria tabescens]
MSSQNPSLPSLSNSNARLLIADGRSITTKGSSISPVIPFIPSYDRNAVAFRAAREATRILREQGYTFAIFGSLACYLYGNNRIPNDVDIVISSYACDPEAIKTLLVAANPELFYLVPSKSPQSSWNVLWYCDRRDKNKEKTKVDILRAGTHQLPILFSEAIVDKQGLPVVPISMLLLHKLKGWRDRMDSPEERHRRKYHSDARDVLSLLVIIVQGMNKQERKDATWWRNFSLERFDDVFRYETDQRVTDFFYRFPESGEMWRILGW